MNTLTKLGIAAAGVIAAMQLSSAKTNGFTVVKVVEGSLVVTPTTCPATGECTILASASWRNDGNIGSIFTPSFIIDGISYPNSVPMTLAPGQIGSYSTTVSVSPAITNHTVCPSPNP